MHSSSLTALHTLLCLTAIGQAKDAPAAHPQGVDRIEPVVAIPAQPFSLWDVRLLDSPFKHAMEKDAEWLLALDPDRFLHGFRESAGLEPKGEIYGGWESQGVAGHTFGHYISACAMLHAATGDERFLQRVNTIVDELAECQAAKGTGYVGAIPDADRIFSEIARGEIRSAGFDLNGCWVPWYTLHKLFAGLIDAYHLCGNEKALAVAVGLADWTEEVTRNLTPELWQRMLACEHGGMNESMADLYGITGDERYLELARKFHHKDVLDPMERREERLEGLHGNTQVPKVIGEARIHELTGDERSAITARFFFDAVTQNHLYAIGGFTSGEHFGPPGRLADRLTTSTAETCKTYNLLKLTRHLFSWTPDSRFTDYYERGLYNHILASQDPDTGMVCYYVPLEPGQHKTYSTPEDSFWCCVGTGLENHVKYADTIYSHDPDTLWVNLFIPSVLTWRDKGVTVRQETRFPEADTTRLVIGCGESTPFDLKVRSPYWLAEPMVVCVNGKVVPTPTQAGGYVSLRRVWSDGDVVEVTLPMGLRLEPLPDRANRVAVLYGPIVLAADLGPVDVAITEPAPGAQPVQAPVLVTDGKPLGDWLAAAPGEGFAFRTQGVGRPEDVTLIPFYRMHHRRYTVYLDLLREDEWAELEAERRAEMERLSDLEARTIDRVIIGDDASERAHNLQGENHGAGPAFGRHWRHAVDGGWMSWELAIPEGEPVELLITYWGSDVGARTFDVLVDGERVDTQALNNNSPNRFFDVSYPLSAADTAGKDRITVRFAAHPRNTAGGVFDLRTLRPEE